MRTRDLKVGSRRIVAAASLAIAILAGAPSPAQARIGDGHLILNWSGQAPEGSAFLLTAPGGDPILILPQDHADHTASVPDLPSGQARLDLAGPDGRPLLRWSLLVAAEVTTVAEARLDTGLLEVSSMHPDPFGNTAEWGPLDLAALPGRGVELPSRLSLPSIADPAPQIRGAPAVPWAPSQPVAYGLDHDATGYQQPLGNVAAWLAAPVSWALTDRGADASLSLLAGGASGQAPWGRVRARTARRLGSLGHTEAELSVAGLQSDDAGPTGIADDELPRNDLEDLEARLRVFARPGGGLLRLHLHARGVSRNHFLQEFARNSRHNPREDRSSLTAAAAWDRSWGPHALWLEAGYARGFTKTGDGQAFDSLRKYRLGINSNNDQVTDDRLYWWGGGASHLSIPPHLYNYFTQALATTWSLRAEGRVGSPARTPLRVGAEAAFTTWRWYEHLDPIIDSGPTDNGFLYASYLGYTRDASAHEDQGLHEAPRPRTLAVFASQRLPLGPAVIEAGARWSRFSSDQEVVRDFSNPIGADSVLDAADFTDPEDEDGVDPRVGMFIPLGRHAGAWIDAGRTREIPPPEALYVSPNRLQQQAGLAREGQLHLDPARNQVFGNPALKPVLTDRVTLGLHRRLPRGLDVRLTGRLAEAHDTWVVRRVEAGVDSLCYYDNRGKQRERGVRISVDAATSARSRLRIAYDLSRRETNVIEPAPLYRRLLYPGLPAEGTGVQETAALPALWWDRPDVEGWFPSLFDRTHQVSAAWLARMDRGSGGALLGPLVDRFDLALVLRAASGRPYTETYAEADGLMGGDDASALIPGRPIDSNGNGRLDASEVHSGRMPWTWQVDLGLQRRFTFIRHDWKLLVEARNLLGRRNPLAVYGATGEADDDGWLESSAGREYLDGLAAAGKDAGAFRRDYLDRLDDPNHYEEGRTLRVALGLDL